ncbi:MAG: PD40 domain-containing protein [Actinobacteria bacterium]|nr:PD40 domain-containing protein [Actinomycetota bacterium]
MTPDGPASRAPRSLRRALPAALAVLAVGAAAGALLIVTGGADRSGANGSRAGSTSTTRPLAAGAGDRQLAFLSSDSSGGTDVMLTTGAGGQVRRIARVRGRAERLAWSPDGTRLVFDGDGSGDFDLYVVDVAAKRVRPIVAPGSNEGSASWSPDGRQLAFFSDRSGSFAGYVAGADGSDPRQVTPAGGPPVSDLAWSPDGRQLAYTLDLGTDSEVWTVGADGGGARRVTSLPGASMPAWSPSGDALAVGAQPSGSLGADIFVARLDGAEPARVGRTPYRDAFPVWAPDGRSIYFTAALPGTSGDSAADDVYRTGADGRGQKDLSRSPGSVESEVAISGDGRFVAFTSTGPAGQDVYVANADLTGARDASRLEGRDSWPAWRPPA